MRVVGLQECAEIDHEAAIARLSGLIDGGRNLQRVALGGVLGAYTRKLGKYSKLLVLRVSPEVAEGGNRLLWDLVELKRLVVEGRAEVAVEFQGGDIVVNYRPIVKKSVA
jgi:hypothetical protein